MTTDSLNQIPDYTEVEVPTYIINGRICIMEETVFDMHLWSLINLYNMPHDPINRCYLFPEINA